MAREQPSDKIGSKNDTVEFSRRGYLKTASIGTAAAVSGLSLGSAAVAANDHGVAPEADVGVSELLFDEQFDGGSLDPSVWGVGFGWGMTSNNDDADVSSDRVYIDNDELVLEVAHTGNGSVTQGAINSRTSSPWGGDHLPSEGFRFSQGMYVECRLQPIVREGILPAFWANPDTGYDEIWPPEIDFFELFHTGGRNDPRTVSFNYHYATNGECNSSGSASTASSGAHNFTYDQRLDETYIVVGCEYGEDYIDFYLDGEHMYRIDESSHSAAVSQMQAGSCNDMYLMFSNHVNRVGTPDYSHRWTEQTRVDYVRVWETGDGDVGPAPGDGDSDDSDDSGSSDDQYFWVRSADGSEVAYEFEVDGGTISIDSNEQTDRDDEWVSDDGTAAGGTTVDGESNGDGYWFSGELTNLTSDGPLETFVDDEPVDPESLAGDDPEEDEPEEEADDQYFWVRSADGSEVSYEFEVDGGTISIDPDEQTDRDDEWVSDDGTAAGGTTVDGGSNGDGYWFSGELTNLTSDGPLETYVDDEPVDPELLAGDEQTEDEPEVPDEDEPDESVDDDTDIDDGSENDDSDADDGDDEAGDSDPVIRELSVCQRTAGPWTRVDISWSVTDEDGDLESVVSELLDGDIVVASKRSSVSGSSVSNSHGLRTRKNADAVRVTVTDEAGNRDETTKSL